MKIKGNMILDNIDHQTNEPGYDKPSMFEFSTSEVSIPEFWNAPIKNLSPHVLNPFEMEASDCQEGFRNVFAQNDLKSTFCFSTKPETLSFTRDNHRLSPEFQVNFNQYFYSGECPPPDSNHVRNNTPFLEVRSIYNTLSDNESSSIISTDSNSKFNIQSKLNKKKFKVSKKKMYPTIEEDFYNVGNLLKDNLLQLTEKNFFNVSRMGVTQDQNNFKLVPNNPKTSNENVPYEIPNVNIASNVQNMEMEPDIAELTKSYYKRSRLRDDESTTKKSFCKCRKSNCMKSYCECFLRGDLCGDQCECKGCANDHAHAEQRSQIPEFNFFNRSNKSNNFILKKKEKNTIDLKNPHCHCSKSGCSKNYCDCYRLGRECSNLCHCSLCANSNRKTEDGESSGVGVSDKKNRIKKIKRVFFSNIIERMKFLSFFAGNDKPQS